MRELLEDILPSLLLLSFVNSRRDQRYEATPPHPGTAGNDVGWKSWTGVVDELSWGIETLAAMAEKAWSIGLAVEIQEEGAVDHCQAPVKNIKTVL